MAGCARALKARPSAQARGWLLVSLALVMAAAEALPPPEARAEIAALIEALAGSGCRFQRNGSWYDGERARTHLQRKYEYLLRKDLVDTAEQFIDRAASASSLSGRPYRVGCRGGEQDAGPWFRARLQQLRARAAAP